MDDIKIIHSIQLNSCIILHNNHNTVNENFTNRPMTTLEYITDMDIKFIHDKWGPMMPSTFAGLGQSLHHRLGYMETSICIKIKWVFTREQNAKLAIDYSRYRDHANDRYHLMQIARITWAKFQFDETSRFFGWSRAHVRSQCYSACISCITQRNCQYAWGPRTSIQFSKSARS